MGNSAHHTVVMGILVFSNPPVTVSFFGVLNQSPFAWVQSLELLSLERQGVECAICFLHLSGTGTLCSISSHDLHEAFWNVVKNHHKMAAFTRCWMCKTGGTWGRLVYNEPLQLRVKE